MIVFGQVWFKFIFQRIKRLDAQTLMKQNKLFIIILNYLFLVMKYIIVCYN